MTLDQIRELLVAQKIRNDDGTWNAYDANGDLIATGIELRANPGALFTLGNPVEQTRRPGALRRMREAKVYAVGGRRSTYARHVGASGSPLVLPARGRAAVLGGRRARQAAALQCGGAAGVGLRGAVLTLRASAARAEGAARVIATGADRVVVAGEVTAHGAARCAARGQVHFSDTHDVVAYGVGVPV